MMMKASKPKKKVSGRRYGPGRPTLEDLEVRKASILDVATQLFISRGFADTSLVDVAKHAGVATRTIYQHYGDKEAIFRAVIEKRFKALRQGLPKLEVDGDLPDILLNTAHYICAIAFEDAAIPFQRLMIAESQRFPDLMKQVFKTSFYELHANVVATFERLEKAGRIPAGDHVETTKFFIDLLLGAAPLQLTMNWISSGPSEKELSDKVALFIAGRFGIQPTSKGNRSRRLATAKA